MGWCKLSQLSYPQGIHFQCLYPIFPFCWEVRYHVDKQHHNKHFQLGCNWGFYQPLSCTYEVLQYWHHTWNEITWVFFHWFWVIFTKVSKCVILIRMSHLSISYITPPCTTVVFTQFCSFFVGLIPSQYVHFVLILWYVSKIIHTLY